MGSAAAFSAQINVGAVLKCHKNQLHIASTRLKIGVRSLKDAHERKSAVFILGRAPCSALWFDMQRCSSVV